MCVALLYLQVDCRYLCMFSATVVHQLCIQWACCLSVYCDVWCL